MNSSQVKSESGNAPVTYALILPAPRNTLLPETGLALDIIRRIWNHWGQLTACFRGIRVETLILSLLFKHLTMDMLYLYSRPESASDPRASVIASVSDVDRTHQQNSGKKTRRFQFLVFKLLKTYQAREEGSLFHLGWQLAPHQSISLRRWSWV